MNVGEHMNADLIFEEVLRDALFYYDGYFADREMEEMRKEYDAERSNLLCSIDTSS